VVVEPSDVEVVVVLFDVVADDAVVVLVDAVSSEHPAATSAATAIVPRPLANREAREDRSGVLVAELKGRCRAIWSSSRGSGVGARAPATADARPLPPTRARGGALPDRAAATPFAALRVTSAG
jgi:hypothetical protein